MKKSKTYLLLLAAAVVCSLVLYSCFSPYQGDNGTFSINFGGGGSSRATFLPWNIDPSGIGSGPYIEELTHIITLSGGPGPDQTISVVGYQTANFSVTPGSWEIDVKGLSGGTQHSVGYAKATIRPGQNGGISVKMHQYYELGVSATGSTAIFYYNKEGFTMADTGEICHYLEASAGDANYSASNFNLIWGSTAVPGTGTAIGTGRYNTMQINEFNPDFGTYPFTAAYHCSTFGSDDWFLPSRDELNQLLRFKNTLSSIPSPPSNVTSFYNSFGGAGTPNTGTGDDFWSSSQSSTGMVYKQDFLTGSQGQSGMNSTYRARPIRAF